MKETRACIWTDGAACRRRSPPPVPRPRHAPADPEPTNVVGVFGLSVRTVEQDLEEEFGRIAAVDKVVIVYDARVSGADARNVSGTRLSDTGSLLVRGASAL